MTHLLIPLDLMRSPCDALVFSRKMAEESPVSVTLLHVLNVNICVPHRKIYEELCAESEMALQKLSLLFFGPDSAARIVVRIGTPHEEIVAEARAKSADLILLSGPGRTWKHWWRRGTTGKIIDASPCPSVVLPPRSQTPSPSHIGLATGDFLPACFGQAGQKGTLVCFQS